jgi:hypothetical protein
MHCLIVIGAMGACRGGNCAGRRKVTDVTDVTDVTVTRHLHHTCHLVTSAAEFQLRYYAHGYNGNAHMPKFAANLTFLFNELLFMERFAAAANAGFKAVEYMAPYPYAADDLKAALKANGLVQALFNLPAGDWENGERGTACIPGREAELPVGQTAVGRHT